LNQNIASRFADDVADRQNSQHAPHQVSSFFLYRLSTFPFLGRIGRRFAARVAPFSLNRQTRRAAFLIKRQKIDDSSVFLRISRSAEKTPRIDARPIVDVGALLERKNNKRKKAFFLADFSVKFSRRRSI
jgi:hypothetical protein